MQSIQLNNLSSDYIYLLETAFLLLLIIGGKYLFKHFLKRKNEGKIQLDLVLLQPVRSIFWILLISFLLQLPVKIFGLQGNFTFISTLRDGAIILSIGWLCLRWKNAFYHLMLDKRAKGKISIDLASMELLNKLSTILTLFLVSIFFMQYMGVNIMPLLTFGGIGAAAIGFASKDVFANFFGGLMLNITRPFLVHDLIELPQKKLTGHIENIGWYLTVLRDLEKKPIYVPNSVFSSELVVNLSRITNRRIDETLELKFTEFQNCPSIVEEIRKLFNSCVELDRNLPIDIHVKTLSSIGIQLEIKAYTITTRYDEYMAVKQRLLVDICRIVSEANGFSNPVFTIEQRTIS